MKIPTYWYAIGGVSVGFLAWILYRRRAAESFAESAGRAVGESAVELVGGVAKGTYDAIHGGIYGAAEKLAGVKAFAIERVEGRQLSPVQTNLKGLQGILAEPEGEDKGTYTVEVQNTSSKSLAGVKIELVVDKWGMDAVRESVGVVDIPAGTGVRGTGTILIRSATGIIPVTAKLYADNYLLAKAL
jgi:hypothetical protein